MFGDAGNDRIVGAGGNDVIVGGAGYDSMHGGGGDDVFCFCAGFGHDTVEQLATGSVTLWFAEGDESCWNSNTLTYDDGTNSVTVNGTNNVSVRFGSVSDEFDRYRAMGAFDSSTSTSVFLKGAQIA